MYITKEEINKKFQNVFLKYDEVLDHFSNNRAENGFLSLNNLRLANSEVYNYIFNYNGRDTDNQFQLKPEDLGVKFSFDKILENKLKNYQIQIFEKIAKLQNTNLNYNIELVIRLYIERYLPLVWNKEIDLLIICNNTEPLLLRELMKMGQKNIFVLNQQCKEINELIKKNNKLYDGLKLLDNKLDQEVNNFFENKKKYSHNIRYCVWHDFNNNFKNTITYDEVKNLKNKINISHSSIFAKTSDRFKKLWVSNGLKNLSKLKELPNVNRFRGKFKNQSVVIVCPGPSLKKDIKHLKKLSNKIIICAVGHSLGILADNKIKPDIVIHIDPIYFASSHWTSKGFNSFDFKNVELLILSATCDNALFNKNAKNIAWLSVNNAYDNWIHEITGEKNNFSHSRNVAHISLWLLADFGFKNISFLGLDHSYEGKKIYINSSKKHNDDNLRFAQAEHFFNWPSKVTGQVKTDNTFINSIHSFEKIIDIIHLKNKAINLYNCTSQGALIKGFSNITFLDYLDIVKKEKNKLLNFRIDHDFSKFTEEDIKIHYFSLLSKVTDIQNLLQMALKILNDMALNKTLINSFSEKTTEIIKIINTNEIFTLISKESLNDYQQRKNINTDTNDELLLLKVLFENLACTFEQFHKFLVSLKVRS